MLEFPQIVSELKLHSHSLEDANWNQIMKFLISNNINLQSVAIQMSNTGSEPNTSTVLLDGIKELYDCGNYFALIPLLNIQYTCLYNQTQTNPVLSTILKSLVEAFSNCMLKMNPKLLRFHMKEGMMVGNGSLP